MRLRLVTGITFTFALVSAQTAAAVSFTYSYNEDSDLYYATAPVTQEQYQAFLNATVEGAYDGCGHLWNGSMGITRSGSAGSYTYSGGGSSPLVHVTLIGAMHFINWLNNGQGSSSSAGVYDPLNETSPCSYSSVPTYDSGSNYFIASPSTWSNVVESSSIREWSSLGTGTGDNAYTVPATGPTWISATSHDGSTGFRPFREYIDRDSDGIDEETNGAELGSDNLPKVSNSSQLDSDGDTKRANGTFVSGR